ncbi:hypothetical protein yc1106_06910 [Curvularia clavata]|uniref:Prion-inhibition and propagation HeLo domain-containing protein n=1 Tax=Curvularia clavata TaxID=95742 RepID=A0A9Q8ZCF4_CURCL|nr:hypothetical protein yc1106_06910 [Curvularia clavata]
MTEAAGLAVSAVALASLFNNTIECFEFVQLGCTFGKSFQTSQLKLDNARLRLSRWGKSLGLDDQDVRESTSLKRNLASKENVGQAEALLGQIVELFVEAEGVSEKYKSRKAPQGSLAVYNPQTDLDPSGAKLHEKMRQLSIERQNCSGIRKKAKWALYQEKQFRRLIEDITDLVDGLENLFPAAQPSRRQLCDAEVSILEEGLEGEAMSVLKDITAAQDKLLEQAITESGAKSYHIAFSGNGNCGFQLGHNSGTISGITFGRDS